MLEAEADFEAEQTEQEEDAEDMYDPLKDIQEHESNEEVVEDRPRRSRKDPAGKARKPRKAPKDKQNTTATTEDPASLIKPKGRKRKRKSGKQDTLVQHIEQDLSSHPSEDAFTSYGNSARSASPSQNYSQDEDLDWQPQQHDSPGHPNDIDDQIEQDLEQPGGLHKSQERISDSISMPPPTIEEENDVPLQVVCLEGASDMEISQRIISSAASTTSALSDNPDIPLDQVRKHQVMQSMRGLPPSSPPQQTSSDEDSLSSEAE
jgi:hypothetical protein